MKPLLLSLSLMLCVSLSLTAQYVTIPDPAFVTWLQSSDYSSCMSGNQLDTLCSAGVAVNGNAINNSSIVNLSGVEYLSALEELYIDCPALTIFPAVPSGLKLLSISNGNSNMPLLPNGLRSMSVSGSIFSTLQGQLPTSLRNLTILSGNISALPALPDSLYSLYVQFNPITTLPTLPDSLRVLEIINCSLASLPALPNGLNELSISGNYVTAISAWPDSLRIADISSNFQIASVPPFPSQLKAFTGTQTNISVIPALPPTIRTLECNYTQVTSIPHLPANMDDFGCINSQVTFITNFPDSVGTCGISNNPNLVCIPPLGHVDNLYMYGTGITCLPNYGTVGSSNPPLSTFLLCGLYNTNGCTIISNMAGKDYLDENNDCTPNNAETGKANVKHTLWKNGVMLGQTFSGTEGYYSFDVSGIGNYEVHIDTAYLPFDLSCPLNGAYYDTVTATDSLFYNNNFALKCKQGFDLAAMSVVSPARYRPGVNVGVDFIAGDASNLYGAHCASGVSGTVTVTINGPATYIGPLAGSVTPTAVNGNTITWNVADFGTTNASTDFNIIVQTDTVAQAGQQVCFTLHITPTAGDNNPANNNFDYCFTVRNSYDPNEKEVYPAADIDTAQKWLTYTVRFQNTGNAEAQHIYVMDTLDANVDESTFQLLAYSHQPNVQINEKIIRFNFPNINLPDSTTDEPNSHGYVQYKVKLKPNLPVGTQVSNTAYIYFDFNSPVVTNTVTNTVAVDTSVTIDIHNIAKDNNFAVTVYPNPANQQLTVATTAEGCNVSIYSTQGQLVNSYVMQGTAQTFNISTLPSGIYYVEVQNKRQMMRRKLVKL